MNYENYDLTFPDQPVVDQYLPIWDTLPTFRSKPAFIWAESDPARPAQHITYSDLNHSARTISSNLLLSLQKGDTVMILSPPGLELVELIFACQRAGLVSIPVSPPDPYFSKNTHHHFVRVLSQTKPKGAIAPPNFIKDVQNYLTVSPPSNTKVLLENLVWLSTDEIKDDGKVFSKIIFSNYKGCRPDDVYLIQYTSGATSIPKPVLVTAGSAAHNVREARKCYDLNPNSVITSWLPQYHDCGLMFLLLTVVSGATCVLTSPESFIKRPRLWLELITQYKATCTPVPSFALPLVVKRGGVSKGTLNLNLSSMKILILINEPIYKAVVDEFVEVFSSLGLNRRAISPSYGLAENCTFVSTAWTNPTNDFVNDTLPCYKKLLPIARLGFDNNDTDNEIEIMIVNEDTNEAVSDGVEGEIWVSSPSNALGYLGYPSLTSEIFQKSIKNVTGRTFLRTGDRGVIIGQERYVFVMGRCSDILVQKGKETHPHYIEKTAYGRFSNFLRGGCIAAFEISSKITIVAEMAKEVLENRALRKICEGMREIVMKENGVDVGVVSLVKSGDVPKTTSGKVQRWLAKYKLLEGEMSVIMQMQFDDHMNALQKKVHEFEGEGRSDEGGEVVDQEKGGVYLSFVSKVSTSLPLHSSL